MKNAVVILCLVGVVFAQKVQNIEQKIEKGRVVIIYDLKGDSDEIYDIKITAANDEKTIIPRAIAGDLTDIKPGKNHEIWWEPILECIDVEGWTISLKSKQVLIDIDGNVYETVQIGDQEWMAENLKVTHYRNGDAIPTGHSGSKWKYLSTGAYAVYDNNESFADTYGYLYNWHAVDDARGLAPEGWHVPTGEEWMELEMALGMSESEANSKNWRGTDQGSQLAGRADLWKNGDLENNTNFGTRGFNVLPGGYRRSTSGSYRNMGSYGYFWSSTEGGSYYATWYRRLGYSNSAVLRGYSSKRNGFSVRCIRTVE